MRAMRMNTGRRARPSEQRVALVRERCHSVAKQLDFLMIDSFCHYLM